MEHPCPIPNVLLMEMLRSLRTTEPDVQRTAAYTLAKWARYKPMTTAAVAAGELNQICITKDHIIKNQINST